MLTTGAPVIATASAEFGWTHCRMRSRQHAALASPAAEYLVPYADRPCDLQIVQAAGNRSNSSQAANDKGLAAAKPLS
jgi:hypothetical protein